jgi:hypothetical protein
MPPTTGFSAARTAAATFCGVDSPIGDSICTNSSVPSFSTTFQRNTTCERPSS